MGKNIESSRENERELFCTAKHWQERKQYALENHMVLMEKR